MSDLVSAGYPISYPHAALSGRIGNAVQGNLRARDNLEFALGGALTDGALAATGVGCAVAVPVSVGDPLSKVSIIAGATAEATGTHAWAAVYSGIAVPALITQSPTETGAAAVAASVRHEFALAGNYVVTKELAPYGFVYVSISVTATTVPTAAVFGFPAAIGYQWFANGPLFIAATHGSALAGTAPATIASPTAKAVAPIVFLH